MYELFTEIDDIEPTEGAFGVTHTCLSKAFPNPVILEVNGQIPEQYSELNEEEWELDDNCPLCQELKKSGSKLQWYPDEPELQRGKRPH